MLSGSSRMYSQHDGLCATTTPIIIVISAGRRIINHGTAVGDAKKSKKSEALKFHSPIAQTICTLDFILGLFASVTKLRLLSRSRCFSLLRRFCLASIRNLSIHEQQRRGKKKKMSMRVNWIMLCSFSCYSFTTSRSCCSLYAHIEVDKCVINRPTHHTRANQHARALAVASVTSREHYRDRSFSHCPRTSTNSVFKCNSSDIMTMNGIFGAH